MRYKAFISHSHAVDGKLAPALQSGLHSFAKPWYKLRSIRVFRDQTNLAVSPQLWSHIEEALGQSEYFLLLASPGSASSKWARREMDFWLKNRLAGKLLIVLTEGELVWDDAGSDFDWRKTTAVPTALQNRFQEEPLFLDFRWARSDDDLSLHNPKFRNAIADVGSTLHGKSKDELVGEDVRQHRRTKRLAWGAICLLLGLTLAASIAAYSALRHAREARREQNSAVARYLAAQSSLVLKDTPGRVDRSLLLAVESMQRAPSFDSDAAVRQALSRYLKLARIQSASSFHAVVFGPNSHFVAVATSDNAAELFDLPTGNRRLRMAHPDSVLALALSQDGQYLATSCSDSNVRIFSLETNAQIGQLSGLGRVAALDFSPDGRFLATGGQDKMLRVFKSAEWKQVLALGQEGPVIGTSFSPDGRYLLSESEPGDRHQSFSDWRIFDATTGKEVILLKGDKFLAIAAGTDGKFAGIKFIGRAVIFDTRTRKQLEYLPGRYVSAIAFSRDGKSLAACGGKVSDHDCWLLRPTSPPEKFLELSQQDIVGAVSFSPDSRYVATTTDARVAQGTIRVFDASTGAEVGDIPHQGKSGPVLFSPDSSYLATRLESGDLRIYELPTDVILRIPHRGPIFDITLSAGGQSVTYSGRVHVFDVASGRELLPTLDLGSSPRVALSPEGSYIGIAAPTGASSLASNREPAFSVLNLVTGEEVFRYEFETDSERFSSRPLDSTIALSANGQRVAIGLGGVVTVIELPGRKQVFQRPTLGRIRSLAITPDGHYLAAGMERDKVAHVYDLSNEKEVLQVPHKSIIYSVAFSPDSRYFGSGSRDKTVPIYDLARKRGKNLEHQENVFAIAFSAKNNFVATGGLDKTARVFDLATGKEVMRLSHPESVKSLAFSPDGQYLITAAGVSGDVLVSRYFLRPQDLINEGCSRLTRNLTIEEWNQYLGDQEPYRKTCPRIPETPGEQYAGDLAH